LDGHDQPVPDAVLEIWAPGTGTDECTAEGYPVGFGRVATNDLGEFDFVVPRPPGSEHDGRKHAPHLAVLVFMRGLLRHLVTRLYFPDEPANALDPVLQLVPEERRRTLIATAAPEKTAEFSWDIHLQGEQETVFYEV